MGTVPGFSPVPGFLPRLLILRALPTQWVPRSSLFLRRVGVGNAGAERVDHVSTTKSNSTRSIAAHPCKNARMRPSVGMVHAKIVKGGPRAPQHIPQWGWSVGGVWLGILAETSSSNGRSESTEIPRVLPENPSIYAKFTQMTSPFELRTGPPLPPWALEAS